MIMKIDELDKKQQMRVIWMDSSMKCEEFSVYVDKNGTVKNIIEQTAQTVNYPQENIGKLR